MGRNVRVGRGELDLVAILEGRPVAVEVKTIRGGGLEDASFAFNSEKAAQVRRLANQLGISRVDLIAISVDRRGVDFRWVQEVA